MTKVFDACIIHSETDMLYLRLNILRDVIDYFVVVESGMTHSGQPKAQIVGKALATEPRFAEFADQIIYVYAEHLQGENSWAREAYHRGLISGVLEAYAQPDDWVIVGDVDEILRAESVKWVTDRTIADAVIELDFLYYDFAHRVQQGWGIGMCRWSVEKDANKIRRGEFLFPPPHIEHGGVHLSYFMTPEQVVTKLDSFMHSQDVAKDVPRDPAWIADKMRNGMDLFGRTVEIVEVDPEPYLPEYVKAHREEYERLGWLKPVQESVVK